MTKIAIIISWISLLIVLFTSLWIWHGLPDLPNETVQALPSKGHVFFILFFPFAVMAIVFPAFLYAPKLATKFINSKRLNLKSKKAGFIDFSDDILPLSLFWIGMMIILTVTHILTIKSVFLSV